MQIVGFLARRFGQLVVTLLVSSFVIFGALYLSPGNPIEFLTHGRVLTPAEIEAISRQYHLNEPFPVRYWDWLTGVIHGDLGRSLVYGTPVTTLIGPRIANTLELVVVSAIMILAVGIGLGLVAALRGPWADRSITVSTTIGLAVPSFVAASVLITFFALDLGWFPVFGEGGGGVNRVWHLTLPAIALAIASVGYVSRITRASVRAELSSEHVQTARARGLPEHELIRHHVIRNAMIPITTAAGISIASLIPGVAVVETIFGLNGIGAYLIDAVNEKDFAVVQGICLVLVAAFVVVNMIVDVLYFFLDPRTRKAVA